jgi:single stranded DNA-binding protein
MLSQKEKEMSHKVVVVGNVGQDSELRHTADGTPVLNFSVAANETWNDRDGNRQQRVTWFRCTVWGQRAQGLHPYVVKGTGVEVWGMLQPDDRGGPKVFRRNDGSAGANYELRVIDFSFANGGGRKSQSTSQSAPQAGERIPF